MAATQRSAGKSRKTNFAAAIHFEGESEKKSKSHQCISGIHWIGARRMLTTSCHCSGTISIICSNIVPPFKQDPCSPSPDAIGDARAAALKSADMITPLRYLSKESGRGNSNLGQIL